MSCTHTHTHSLIVHSLHTLTPSVFRHKLPGWSQNVTASRRSWSSPDLPIPSPRLTTPSLEPIPLTEEEEEEEIRPDSREERGGRKAEEEDKKEVEGEAEREGMETTAEREGEKADEAKCPAVETREGDDVEDEAAKISEKVCQIFFNQVKVFFGKR